MLLLIGIIVGSVGIAIDNTDVVITYVITGVAIAIAIAIAIGIGIVLIVHISNVCRCTSHQDGLYFLSFFVSVTYAGTSEHFCQMKKSEPLYGYQGALKCLKEYGDVGFFHSYDVLKDYDNLRDSYALVCKDVKSPNKITWTNIENPKCHLNVEYPNVSFENVAQGENITI